MRLNFHRQDHASELNWRQDSTRGTIVTQRMSCFSHLKRATLWHHQSTYRAQKKWTGKTSQQQGSGFKVIKVKRYNCFLSFFLSFVSQSSFSFIYLSKPPGAVYLFITKAVIFQYRLFVYFLPAQYHQSKFIYYLLTAGSSKFIHLFTNAGLIYSFQHGITDLFIIDSTLTVLMMHSFLCGPWLQ